MSLKMNRELRFSEDIMETNLDETINTATAVVATAATDINDSGCNGVRQPLTVRMVMPPPRTREVATETEGCRRATIRRLSRSTSITAGSRGQPSPPPPPTPIDRRSRKFRRVMSLVKWKRQSNETSVMNVRQEFSTRIVKPNDYFFFSVFTSLFCFLPLGNFLFCIPLYFLTFNFLNFNIQTSYLFK